VTVEQVPYELIEKITLDPYSSFARKVVTVIDSDALLPSIDNHCRTHSPSRILRIAESRSSVAFAADHVYGETYQGFEKLAKSSSASVDELRACFEEDSLPVIRWVTTPTEQIVDERVSLVTDVTDIPTAQLASLIAPCLVLSQDKSLRRPGFAPDEWRPAAGHGADIVRAAGEQEGGAMVMGLPVVGVVGGGIKLGEAVGLPWWASLAIMGAGGYLILRSPDRRRTISEKVWPVVEIFFEMMAEAVAREQAATQELKGVLFEPAVPPTVKQQIATVLARTREPQLAQEIQAAIELHFDDDPPPTVTEVRDVLKASPEFTTVERYRWQLGRLAGPCAHAPADQRPPS
jgi:hypothetical protein